VHEGRRETDRMLDSPRGDRFLRGEASVLELAAQPRAPLAFSLVTGKPQSSVDGWRDMFGLTLTAR
jgi:hypothetical protein